MMHPSARPVGLLLAEDGMFDDPILAHITAKQSSAVGDSGLSIGFVAYFLTHPRSLNPRWIWRSPASASIE